MRNRAPWILAGLISMCFGLLLPATTSPVNAQMIAEYPTPAAATPAGDFLAAITGGPDGAMWFTTSSKIGRISTSSAVTEFPVTSASATASSITSGPDGALWFIEGTTAAQI